MDFPAFLAVAALAVIVLLWLTTRRRGRAEQGAATDYLEQVKAEIQGLLDTKGADGKLSMPIYDPTAFNYRPVGDEKVVGCLDGVQRLEVRNTGRYFRGGGVGEGFMRGLLGRRNAHLFMGSPRRIAEKQQRVTAKGRLIVTDEALAFEGDTKNERLSWEQIADVQLLADGAEIRKRNGPPRVYMFTKLDPKFAAVLFAISKRKP